MQNQSNMWQAYFNYYKIIMGIGILAVPQAAENIGWLYFIILVTFIAYIAIQSNLILMDIAHHLNQDNMLYSDILKLVLGGIWPILGDLMLIICQIGACVAYLIIFTESLAAIIDNMEWKAEKYQIYLCTLIIIVPLSLIKKIHFFSTYSQYAIYLALIGLGIVITDNLYSIQQKQHNGFKYTMKIQNTFQFLGISILLFSGALSLPPIRASLKEKSEINYVIQFTIITVCLCSLMITFPYLYVNSDNQEEIVLFTIKNTYAKFAAMFFYTLSLLISYPLNLFPPVMIFEQLIDDKQDYQKINENLNEQIELIEILEPEIKTQNYFATNPLELIIRFMFMIIIYTIAFNIPNIADFLNYMGSIFCSVLEYILPVLVHYLHFKRIPGKVLPVGKYIIILTTGGIALTLGTTTAIQGMIS